MYSGSEDGTVKIWDLRSPGFQRDYESRAGAYGRGQRRAWGWGGVRRQWLRRVSGHVVLPAASLVRARIASPRAPPRPIPTLSSGAPPPLKPHHLHPAQRPTSPRPSSAPRAGVNSVALHANQGELVSGDASGALRVWDLAANRCCNELVPEGDTPISSVTLAADASLVVAGNYNGSVFFWNPRASDDYVPLRRIQVRVGSGPFQRSHACILRVLGVAGATAQAPACPRYSTPLPLPLSLHRCRSPPQAHRNYVLAARLSPDVRLLATASADRTVKVWNARDGTLLTTLAGASCEGGRGSITGEGDGMGWTGVGSWLTAHCAGLADRA